MRVWTKVAFVLLFVPIAAVAQYRDLDVALSNLNRGFGSEDVQAIVGGVADGEQVQLQFPGIVDQSGFFGRDQAALLLDSMFNEIEASGFEETNTKKQTAENQYHITARWSVKVDGRAQARDLYITLRQKNDRWSIASIRSASR